MIDKLFVNDYHVDSNSLEEEWIMAEEKKYDVIIIGAGPGGMTTALYASRANLKVVMLDRGAYGGNLNNTASIVNYSGFKDVQGPELAEKMYQGGFDERV